MRLTPEQADSIRRATAEIFGPDARVRLFGSRLDDDARGGDIDLLVETDQPVAELPRKRVQLVARLQMRLGDQPIDVLVSAPGHASGLVHEAALREGVRL
jgi:predicted nucleotidyltransferase